MFAIIITICIGIITCILGIIHTTGNISSLHKYHRHRVREEDKKPFGKLVGLGTIIIGLSVIIAIYYKCDSLIELACARNIA